jgi:uncharacterized membrane protein
MSDLIVLTFENDEEATQVMKTIKSLRKESFISLDDTAVVVKDQEGKIHVKNEIDRGIKLGAGVGSLMGLFLGMLFGGPIGAMLLGGAGGALVGKLTDMGVDQKFVKQLKEELEPGSSALFLLVRDAHTNAAMAALRPYKGTVYHTTLGPEAEEELQRVLKDRF